MPRDDEAPGDTVADTRGDATLQGVGPPSSVSGPAPRLSLRDYELGALLGRGGMGDVVLARDKGIGRDVAVKQLRSEKAAPEDVARFLREARVQARLEHPAIVPVYQIGQDDLGHPYFTMKRLTGTTLAEQLAGKIAATPPRQRMLRWFREACNAVAFAHSKKVVHRDLKPSNIMVGEFGEVYVLDWGLARMEGERAPAAQALGDDISSDDGTTQAGAMLGTPGYMAPEQIEDATSVTPAADVYALGSILFEILTGETLHPRGRGAIASTLKGIEDRPATRAPAETVPPELDELCVRCLETVPARRPPVTELAERLEAFLDGDRDVERRRELAVGLVKQARDALSSNDVTRRAEAMQAAGRALVLDPSSVDAAALVSRMTFEPTTVYPEQLRNTLSAQELAIQKRQGRVAMGSFVVVMLYLGIAATNGVANIPFVVALSAYVLVHSVIVWKITQKPASPNQMLYVAFGNSLLAALLSRTLGSMLVVPAITCIMALSLTSYPQLIDRRWLVIGFLVTSWVVPVLLEQVGVLQQTWQIEGHHVVLSAHVLTIGGLHTYILLLFCNVAAFVVFGLFASAQATSRRDAMQQSEIQAWHLRQLLPSQRVR